MTKLYTKGGDAGTTTIRGGERVDKTDIRVVACGDIDELNCHIGMLATLLPQGDDLDLLFRTQRNLFLIGSHLPNNDPSPTENIGEEDIILLENAIDRLQHHAPPLSTFVLPGGCAAAAQSHICRAVCRRTERSVVALSKDYDIDPAILRFLNRLSDFFFILAIDLNFITNTEEKKLHISCR